MTTNADNGGEAIFDLDKNCASLKINKDIYVRILSKAMEQTKKDISDLEEALPVEDFVTYQSITHRLKGDYDNMRITVLSALAKQMNDLARQNPDKEKLSFLLDHFRNQFLKLEEFIARGH